MMYGQPITGRSLLLTQFCEENAGIEYDGEMNVMQIAANAEIMRPAFLHEADFFTR